MDYSELKPRLILGLILLLIIITAMILASMIRYTSTNYQRYYSSESKSDSVAIEDSTKLNINPNSRYRRAMINPNSTDPIKGLTFSAWDD